MHEKSYSIYNNRLYYETILICIYVKNYKGIATIFFLRGIFTCLDASIKSTVGKNADGEEVDVFLFFGLIYVQGSYFLYPHSVAISIGILRTSGLNQMRDGDRQNGKYTFVVKIGLNIAKLSKILLVLTPFGIGSFFGMRNKR